MWLALGRNIIDPYIKEENKDTFIHKLFFFY